MSIIDTLSRPREFETGIQDRFTPKQICGAVRTVFTFTLTDAFDLTPDESLWLSYTFGEILSPFEAVRPNVVPTPVSHELNTRQYSNSLERRERGAYCQQEKEVEDTNRNDWVDVLMEMLASSYQMKSTVEAEIRANFLSMLEELGVGAEKSPRGALYLPNSVRWNLARKASID